MAEKRKVHLSEEERKRRSDLAKRLRDEGKLGGKQKGSGRPKKARAQEVVAEEVKKDGQKLYKTLIGLVADGSDTIKLKAALALLDIETKEHETQMKQMQLEYEQMDRTKLLELIQERFAQLKEQGVDIEGIILGSARDIGRKRVASNVEADGRALPPGEVSGSDRE